MPTIAGLLVSFLTKLFTSGVARYLAIKAVLITLFVVVLPRILNNLIAKFIDISINLVNSFINSGNAINVNFTGLASYILNQIYFTQWFSIILSAILLKVSLRLIPIVKPVN